MAPTDWVDNNDTMIYERRRRCRSAWLPTRLQTDRTNHLPHCAQQLMLAHHRSIMNVATRATLNHAALTASCDPLALIATSACCLLCISAANHLSRCLCVNVCVVIRSGPRRAASWLRFAEGFHLEISCRDRIVRIIWLGDLMLDRKRMELWWLRLCSLSGYHCSIGGIYHVTVSSLYLE